MLLKDTQTIPLPWRRIPGLWRCQNLRFECVWLYLLFLPSLAFATPGYYEPWGKDADLLPSSTPTETPYTLSPAGHVAEALIHFHQNVLSPVDGPRSHFTPSSSQYMLLAIRQKGFITGFLMGCDRLLRENDDDWVYRTIVVNDRLMKYDPVK